MLHVSGIHILKLAVRESPIVNDSYNRAYTLAVNDQMSTIFDVAEEVNSSGNIRPQSLAKIAPSLLTLSEPTDVVGIVNGYAQHRLSFTLTAVVRYFDKSQSRVVLGGYTESDEFMGRTGRFNENLVFYITSVERSDIHGNKAKPGGFGNLFHPTSRVDPDSDKHWITQRPTDIITDLWVNDMQRELGSEVENHTNSLDFNVQSASIVDNSPLTFSSNFLNGYMSTMSENDDFDTNYLEAGEGDTSIAVRANSRITDDTLSNDLLEALSQVQGKEVTGTFVLSDLVDIDPEFREDKVTYYKFDSREITDYRDKSEYDDGMSDADQMASTLNILAVNTLQRARGVRAKIFMSNESLDPAERYIVEVPYLSCQPGIRERDSLRQLVRVLREEVFTHLDGVFHLPFSVKITVELFGECIIDLKVDGEHIIKVFYAFASNATSPILKPDYLDTGVDDGFANLIDMLGMGGDDDVEDDLPFMEQSNEDSLDLGDKSARVDIY